MAPEQSRYRAPLRSSMAQDITQSSGSDVAILGDGELQLLEDSEDTVDGMATIGEPVGKETRFFGPSSNIALLEDISKLLLAKVNSIDGTRGTGQQKEQLVSRIPSPQPSAYAPTPATPANPSPCLLPSEPHGSSMIEHFFSDTGMLFPFVSKEYITRTYWAAKANQYRGVRRSWLSLLNMIFAFATFTSISDLQSMEKNIEESKVYFNRAQELLAASRLRLADLELGKYPLLIEFIAS
ncbi:hypothetical protein LTR70_005464 [Exophiala xenobiotica]|uniref:Uncharacterized protein n=1 Tax=Lithohypha guttulata TaxID=1690604 RepID=A0ABR0K9W6_9EURO|nr:hypothetical protein LTR24_005206 [Lithohypha guttulata]KAK5318441.1 hypothetical protein LTR70_005464 [Exophiala xenobiotica]